MPFVLGVAAALLVGILAGGRIERLTAVKVAWWQAAPVALGLQLLAIYGLPGLDRAALVAVLVGSQLALLVVALRNWRTFGVAVAGLGVAMNLAVMVANGGLMPISPETLAASGRTGSWRIGDGSPGTHLALSKDVIVPVAETRLELLADRFHAGVSKRLDVVFSLGDVVLLVGVAAGIVRAMTHDPNTPLEEHHETDAAGRRARRAFATR
jgi:hypothetical protein